MRILAASLPAYGHLHPLVPLLQALRDGGHDVHVATGEDLTSVVAAAGLRHVPVAPDFGRAMGELATLHADVLQQPREERLGTPDEARLGTTLFGDLLGRQGRDLWRPVVADLRPDVVLYEETALGALLAARAEGVPAVCHTLGRRIFPGLIETQLERRLVELEDGAGAAGLSLRGDLCVELCPPSLRLDDEPTPGAVMVRPVAWNAPADAPQVRRGARPLVYVTLGTVVFGAVEVLRACVDGLAGLVVDVLVTVGPVGDPDALGDLPANVRAERFVDQRAVLQEADVVVSHCGSGTLLGTLAAGLPQLALPTGSPDQFRNADALVAAGAGLRLLPAQVQASAVEQAVARLLDEPSHRAAAVRLSEEIAAMPAPAQAAEQLRLSLAAVGA